MAGSDHHVVGCPGEAQHVGSTRTAVVVMLGGLLSLHLLLPSLKHSTVGVEDNLPGLEALGLLLDVSHAASRTLVQRCELRAVSMACPSSMKKHSCSGEWPSPESYSGLSHESISRKSCSEGHQPRRAREDDAVRHLSADETL